MCDKVKRCVCCGNTNSDVMTKHHVFPVCFISHLPKGYDIGNNVVDICIKCHRKYERKALNYKKDIALEYNINIHDLGKTPQRILSLAKALIRHSENIPLSRKIGIGKEIRKYIGHRINEKKLISIIDDYDNNISFGKIIINKKIESGEINKFVNEWKKHFVSVMKPRFLPKSWNKHFVSVIVRKDW